MICPGCGRVRTKVQDSRTAESGRDRVSHLVTLGHKWANGPDFVARTRVCSCGWRGRTVELLVVDLEALKKGTQETR